MSLRREEQEHGWQRHDEEYLWTQTNQLLTTTDSA